MKTILLKKISILFLLIFSFFNIFSQESWEFGERYKAYVHVASAPLKVVMHSGTSLGSGGFVSAVGGVAFVSIASPDASLENIKIKYNYISSKPDGSRLRIIAGNDTVFANLYDWQLIPIVKYANSEYNSCVSLFGPKTNNKKYDITFHKAFQNTLLGIRLLQSDMALMDLSTHWQLPTNNGKKVLGKGEKFPDSMSWESAANTISSIMYNGKFQSWVFTDDSVNVTFKISDKKISFSGYPYYYFWIKDTAYQNSELEKIYYKYSKNNLKQLMNDLRYYYQKGATSDANNIFMKILEIDTNIFNEINNIEYKIQSVKELTDSLKDEYDLFLNYNKPVYSTALNVVHYSAFFRYLKKINPADWNNFYTKVSKVHITPVVKTPTILPKHKYINE